jgi:uncharacterized protein
MVPKTKEEIAAIQKYRSSILLTRDEILTLQNLRNTSLLTDEDSPVPLEARNKSFKGLRFFRIDEGYQFNLKMKPENPDPIRISLSNGEKAEECRAGSFIFKLQGKMITLHAYKHGNDAELFLPFRDKTSGSETYGAGRYLNLYPSLDGSYVLDFNLAYNPMCAFDEKKYSCPLPPAENWLMNIEIRAGEMRFEG